METPEDEEDEEIWTLMRMHPVQPTFMNIPHTKERNRFQNKSNAMKKLDANTKNNPVYLGSPEEKEETLYSVPLRADWDLIWSPKGLKF